MDAFIVGVILVAVVRRPAIRLLWLVWPAWVAFAVMATGNHYWLDIAAGIVIAVATAAALRPDFVRSLRSDASEAADGAPRRDDLEDRRLAPDGPDVAQDVAHLADVTRTPAPLRPTIGRHHVTLVRRRRRFCAQPRQLALVRPALVVAVCAQRLQAVRSGGLFERRVICRLSLCASPSCS